MILYTPILLGVLGIILIQYIEKGKVMVLQNKQKVSSQWQYKKIIQKLEDFLESKLLQNIPTGNDAKKIEKKIILQ